MSATLLTLVGCGGSNARTHESFTINDMSVAQLVSRTINQAKTSSPGLAGKPMVHCELESRRECAISYYIRKLPGGKWEQETIAPTRTIWKALFEDQRVSVARITVEVPAISGRRFPVEGRSVLYALTCERSEVRQINWDTISPKRLRSICKFSTSARPLAG